ncbi:helix-turn-helix domain-containing protein [Methylopila sp. M107]|uniref:helix-turn-helix domain-containing protein n=1 Tax=Methylopila sp. M107 TaxID=1101190 RepID=UPI00036F03A0|nr:helix-turn-helix domain-containing protein [Methylopila sp. M107]
MSRIFDEIAEGLREAASIAKGEADPSTYRVHIPASVDVKAIRRRTGLTQRAFATQYGFALGTLRDWEQGRSNPDGVARSLLVIIDREPEAVARALVA